MREDNTLRKLAKENGADPDMLVGLNDKMCV